MTIQDQHLRQVRVLLVDDAREMRELTRVQLRRRPDLQIVGEAADGLQGIRCAEQLQPNLIICDVTMPEMDGIEAIPLLHQAAPHARILMWSALEDATTVQRAFAAGANGYVVKGGPRQELENAIDDVLAT